MKTAAFTSPLADGIERFLQYKRAAGCRYREEERALRCLDRFLDSHIEASDPVITSRPLVRWPVRGTAS